MSVKKSSAKLGASETDTKDNGSVNASPESEAVKIMDQKTFEVALARAMEQFDEALTELAR